MASLDPVDYGKTNKIRKLLNGNSLEASLKGASFGGLLKLIKENAIRGCLVSVVG